MSQQDNTDTYTVRDFWLAATLVAMGMEVLRVEIRPRRSGERTGPPWTVFVMSDRPDRPQLVQDYHADRLLLSPGQIRTAFRRCQLMRNTAVPGAGREGGA